MARRLIKRVIAPILEIRAERKLDALLASKANYHSTFIRPNLPPGTDVNFYYDINQSILDLDPEKFSHHFLQLIESLEARVDLFRDEVIFPDARFIGWLAALKFACGSFHFGNGFYLARLGSFIDSDEFFDRLCGLAVAATHETGERWKFTAPDLDTWIAQHPSAAEPHRISTANILNYLSREAYLFNYRSSFERFILPILKTNFDLSVRMIGFSNSPFMTTDNDPIMDLCRSNIEALNNYLLNRSASKVTDLVFDFEHTKTLMGRLVGCAIKANKNVQDIKANTDLIEKYNLGTERNKKNAMYPLAKAHILEFQTESRDYTPPLAQEICTNTHPYQPTFHEQFLDLQNNLSSGNFSAANFDFLSHDVLSGLSLGQIHQVIGITRLCPRLARQREILNGLIRRIAKLGQDWRINSNVNLIARCIELNQLEGDIKIAEDNHAGIRYLIENGELKLPECAKVSELGSKIVLFCFDQDRVLPNLLVALLPTLQREGFEFFNLSADCFESELVQPWKMTPRLSANLQHVEGLETAKQDLLCEWVIDPSNRNITCNGINVYQGLYERVSRVQKRFVVDWNAPSSVLFKKMWIRQIDRLTYTLDQVRCYCEQAGIKVLLTSLQSHFAPYCMLRSYADAFPNQFEHVTFNSSYENWKSNMAGDQLSTLTLMNNTRFEAPSHPAFGRAENFNTWYQDVYLPNKEALWEEHGKLVSLNRAGELTPESQAILEQIKERSRKAKRVFCALGKIPYDLVVPYQGGPGHSDMKDWITHMAESVRGSETLLLIKPHPHELSYQISGKPNEGFIDLIESPDNENVFVLPHRGISLPHLDGLVDHFTCWNGSSIAELGANGKSIMASDDWARKNYPIEVFTASNREEATAILRGEKELQMHPDFEEKSKAYVVYLTIAPFAVFYPFANRSASNKDFNRAWINWDKLKNPENIARLNKSYDLIRPHI